MLVQVLVRLCSHIYPADELARKDDLTLLFSAITSWCPQYNVMWRKSAAEVLMTLSRHGLTSNVVSYIHGSNFSSLFHNYVQSKRKFIRKFSYPIFNRQRMHSTLHRQYETRTRTRTSGSRWNVRHSILFSQRFERSIANVIGRFSRMPGLHIPLGIFIEVSLSIQ